MHTFDIQHDPAMSQFVIEMEGETGLLEYEIKGKQMAILHTIVAPALEGRGVGAALAKHAMGFARTKNYTVQVFCAFVAAWLKRHPEYADTVDGNE